MLTSEGERVWLREIWPGGWAGSEERDAARQGWLLCCKEEKFFDH